MKNNALMLFTKYYLLWQAVGGRFRLFHGENAKAFGRRNSTSIKIRNKNERKEQAKKELRMGRYPVRRAPFPTPAAGFED